MSLRLAACLAAGGCLLATVTAGAPAGPGEGDAPHGKAPDLPGARTVHAERSPAQDEAIERARREAEDLRAKLAVTAPERSSLLAEVARLDQQLALARAAEREAALAAEDEQRHARAAAERADALETRLAGVRHRVALVLEALYRSPPDEAWRHVLVPEASDAAGAASVLAQRQADLARELAEASRAAALAREEAGRRARASATLATDAAVRAAEAARARTTRQRRLEAISADRARTEELASELEQAEGSLALDLDAGRLQRTPRRAMSAVAPRTDLPGLDALRGRLPWPLRARAAVRAAFGQVVNPRHGTHTLRHGVVLTASEGEPILAVAPGRVVYADWYKGFGRCLVLDHGAGWLSVSAHAASFMVELGNDVEAGQQVGEVGDTGSLDGPQLYFQLMRQGQPVDPAAWLVR